MFAKVTKRSSTACFAAVVGIAIILTLPLPPAHGGGDGTLVIVNERPLSRQKVVDVLMDSYGLRIMQQLVFLELAKQETRRLGLTVSEADVQRQLDRAIDEIAPGTNTHGADLNTDTKHQALEAFLELRCLTMAEFMIAMERNAHLRKAVETDFHVDEATLREEYARIYGEMVEVRHIQVEATDTPRLHEILELLARPDADFAQIARQLSTNPQTSARGGLMEPFTFTDKDIPAALREVAFSLTPGEVSSSTLTGKMIHILKMERRIPPTDASFEDVRNEVERQLRERVAHQKMNELITKLFEQANIRVLDRKLKREYDQLLKNTAQVQPTLP